MAYIGIDPGKTGAVAILDNSSGDWTLSVHDLGWDEYADTTDPHALHAILSPFKDSIVTLEHVHSMPGQGVVSTFKFGSGFGVCVAACIIAQLQLRLVRPNKWKPAMKAPADKKKSSARATELFPYCGEDLWPLGKHNGRAEAAMLALYGALCDGVLIRGVQID